MLLEFFSSTLFNEAIVPEASFCALKMTLDDLVFLFYWWLETDPILRFPVISKSSRPSRSHDQGSGERHLRTETDDYLPTYWLQADFG